MAMADIGRFLTEKPPTLNAINSATPAKAAKEIKKTQNPGQGSAIMPYYPRTFEKTSRHSKRAVSFVRSLSLWC